MSKQELLGRERRWALPVAVTIALVIVLEVAGFIVLQSANLPTGSRLAPVLRAVDPVSSKLLLAAIMRGVGFALLAIPLAYLFKAASARDQRVRSGLIAAVIAGPVFLAISLILQQVAINDAASQLLGKLPVDHPESVAKDLQSNSTLLQISLGMRAGGAIGFLAWDHLHGATGDAGGPSDPLLGNLGTAAGMILGLATLVPAARPARHPGADDWLIYLLLVIIDRAPGGSRPAAWDAGEAVALEVPQRAARGGGLFGGFGRPPAPRPEDEAVETSASESTAGAAERDRQPAAAARRAAQAKAPPVAAARELARPPPPPAASAGRRRRVAQGGDVAELACRRRCRAAAGA